MSVSITSALRDELTKAGTDPQQFTMQFARWKAGWPANEYSFELFGKDGAYCRPGVGGDLYILRHVHLMPLPGPARRKWLQLFRRESRKTSDRHLIYVQAGGDFLLIYILDEPDAHSVALMRTKDDRALMESFAIIAENFIYGGDVP